MMRWFKKKQVTPEIKIHRLPKKNELAVIYLGPNVSTDDLRAFKKKMDSLVKNEAIFIVTNHPVYYKLFEGGDE